jgi:hypothetical protein
MQNILLLFLIPPANDVIGVSSSMRNIKTSCNTKKVSVMKWTILKRQHCRAVALLKVIKIGGLHSRRPIPTTAECYRHRIAFIDPMTIELEMIVSKKSSKIEPNPPLFYAPFSVSVSHITPYSLFTQFSTFMKLFSFSLSLDAIDDGGL